MGLVGIHNLDALYCFSGVTHCPWCGKEGQNEGTVVNHLWMVHYRLGLVCNKCNDCPTTTSDTLCQHGWQDCQQPGGKILMNQFHRSKYQQEADKNKPVLARNLKQRGPEGMVSIGLPCWA